MKVSKIKLNPVVVSKEQMQAVRKNIFDSEYEKFFKRVDRYSLNSNIYLFGKLLNKFEQDGLEEAQLEAILRGVNRLSANKPPEKKINLVNVIYSTILKRITPENLISGAVKPETYRKIIDNSIKMYESYPLGKGVDYRHILGRLVSLKKMSSELNERLNGIPQRFSAVEWTPNEQIDLVYTLERIYSEYKQTTSDFVVKKSRKSCSPKREGTSFESVEKNYFKNVLKLLWMIQESVSVMLRNAAMNFNDIKDSIELALYFYGKLNYNDAKQISQVRTILEKLKKAEKQLEMKMKEKH